MPSSQTLCSGLYQSYIDMQIRRNLPYIRYDKDQHLLSLKKLTGAALSAEAKVQSALHEGAGKLETSLKVVAISSEAEFGTLSLSRAAMMLVQALQAYNANKSTNRFLKDPIFDAELEAHVNGAQELLEALEKKVREDLTKAADLQRVSKDKIAGMVKQIALLEKQKVADQLKLLALEAACGEKQQQLGRAELQVQNLSRHVNGLIHTNQELKGDLKQALYLVGRPSPAVELGFLAHPKGGVGARAPGLAQDSRDVWNVDPGIQDFLQGPGGGRR